MEPYNGDTPNLINNKILKDIEIDLDVPFKENKNNMINGIGTFYSTYIEPNLFPLIVISMLILYLTIKYIIKRDREENIVLHIQENKPIGDTIKPISKKNNSKSAITVSDDTNISDMISDDYLLTDDTKTSLVNDTNNNDDRILSSLGLDNPSDTKYIDETSAIPLTGLLNSNINNIEPMYNVNKATSLVFGN